MRSATSTHPSGTRKRGGWPRRLQALFMGLVLVLSQVLGLFGTTVEAHAATFPSSVTFSSGGTINYNPNAQWNGTTIRWSEGSVYQKSTGNKAVVYCAEPNRLGHLSGTFAKQHSDAAWSTGGNSTPASAKAQARSICWYGAGGPGYNSDVWPYIFTGFSKWQNDYVLTHILLADVYTANGGIAVTGLSGTVRERVLNEVIGWNSSTNSWRTDSVRWKLCSGALGGPQSSYEAKVPTSSDTFDVFIANTGDSSTQAYIGWDYAPDMTVTFTKAASKDEHSQATVKANANYKTAGAKYDIHDAGTGKKVTSITTGSDGSATAKLPLGSYYAVETEAPAGFKRNPNKVNFTCNSGGGSMSVELTDDPKDFYLRVQKTDGATGTGTAQDSLSLAGAVFSATYQYNGASKTVTAETDKDGWVKFENIPLGKVTIKEVKAPEGYKLSPGLASGQTYNVTSDVAANFSDDFQYALSSEQSSEYRNFPEAFDLTVTKVKGNDNNGSGAVEYLAGVRFEVWQNDENGNAKTKVGWVTTNDRGHASTKDGTGVDEQFKSSSVTDNGSKPWFGEGKRDSANINGAIPYYKHGYTIKEVLPSSVTDVEPMEDMKVTMDQVTDGLDYDLGVIYNKTVRQVIEVVKLDKESGLTVPMAGFKFQLLDENKKPVTVSSNIVSGAPSSIWETNTEGRVTFPSELAAGTYHVQEVTSLAPYTVSSDTYKAVLDGNTAKTPRVTVKVSNEQAKGTATITKLCSEDGDRLAGAEYDVVADADVVDPVGVVHAKAGEVVDHVVTGADGTATTKELYLGSGSASYSFVETKVPAKHVLDPTPVPFTLTWENQTTSVVKARAEQADKPTRVDLYKTVADGKGPLAGVTFGHWKLSEQVLPATGEDQGAIAVRTGSEKTDVRVVRAADDATAAVNVSAPVGSGIELTAEDGTVTEIVVPATEGDDATEGEAALNVAPGTYQVRVLSDDEDVAGAGGVKEVTVEAGLRYDLSIAKRGIFGILGWTVEAEAHDPLADVDPLAYSDADDAYLMASAPEGDYDVWVGGEKAGTVTVKAGEVLYLETADGGLAFPRVLLKKGCEVRVTPETDDKGTVTVKHLDHGEWVFTEWTAPAGYVIDRSFRHVVIDSKGLIDGEGSGTIEVEDDYTKVKVSKRDITNEEEVPGAQLTILDADGKVYDSWTSGHEPHYIEVMPQGTYTLVEKMTPATYDWASAVEFEVLDTGEVQTVVMYDEPISITGDIDKRQQVADPTHEYTEAKGLTEDRDLDEGNRALVTVSDEGRYAYEVDYRSTSNTWVDELTVTDPLEAVADGLADLVSVTTPAGFEDYDGTLNVWYRVSDPDGNVVAPEAAETANQTLDDGHDNPWLSEASVVERIGEDGRNVSYEGWRLWANVPAQEPVELLVADLGLDEGLHVSAVRFEHGRVEAGFTTSQQDWERYDLKFSHDDLGETEAPVVEGEGPEEVEAKEGADGGEADDVEGEAGPVFAPAVFAMQVTDWYREGATLRNSASVELYRNGGGLDDLEDGDDDAVEQTPVEKLPEIGTTLTNAANGSQEAGAHRVQLVDRVAYTGLELVEHTMTGRLMSKATGECVQESQVTFTPEAPDGFVDVPFEVDAWLYGGDDLVAFEYLTVPEVQKVVDEETGEVTEQPVDKVVATHEDMYDEGQTVAALVPGIGTVLATADGSKTAPASQVTLVDTVEYEGLEPGASYVIQGTLMSASTGEAICEGSSELVPEASAGAATVSFDVDLSQLEGTDVVAFEKLFAVLDDGELVEVASHEDLSDRNQTVTVADRETVMMPQTGANALVWAAVALALAVALLAWLRKRRAVA